MVLEIYTDFTLAAVYAACGRFAVILDFREKFFPLMNQTRHVL